MKVLLGAFWLLLAILSLASSSAAALTPPLPLQGRFGCIDAAGGYVVPPIYSHIDSCGGSVIAVYRNGFGGFLDSQGKEILPTKFKLQGQTSLPAFQYGWEPAGELGHVGYIDKQGAFRIPPQFMAAYRFGPSGYAMVFVRDDHDPNWKRVWIDRAGNFVIQPRSDWIGYLSSNDRGIISENGLNNFGYIDHTGTIRIPEQFEKAEPFAANGLAAVEIAGRWGFIDAAGKFVVPARYKQASNFGTSGAPPNLARVILGSRELYIDRFGRTKIALPPGAFTWEGFSGGLAAASRVQDHQWGYINKSGRWVIEAHFQSARAFAANGLAEVMADGKWGYINRAGKLVISPQFENAMSFASNGLAPVLVGRKWAYINSKGDLAIQPQYDSAWAHEDNGLALVEAGRPRLP